GYAFYVEGHRHLGSGKAVTVQIVRSTTSGVESVDVWVDQGHADLSSGVAVFADGYSYTTLTLTPYATGPLLLRSDAFQSMGMAVVLDDEFPSAAAPGLSDINFSCVPPTGGGAGTGANPLIFCGDCSVTPAAPPECGGAIAGQPFV